MPLEEAEAKSASILHYSANREEEGLRVTRVECRQSESGVDDRRRSGWLDQNLIPEDKPFPTR